MERCNMPNCENTQMARQLWQGKKYCVEHYDKLIWDEFFLQYNNWKEGEPVAERLKTILGRLYGENYFKNIGDSYLSQARIRDYAFNFEKTERGCCFEILEYFTFSEGIRKPKNIAEKWEVDIDKRTFSWLSERTLRKNEFDDLD